MKYFNNKYVYFILIFIAVFLFDFIIFQVLLAPLFESNFASVGLGLSLMFSLFIVIPSMVAYYLSIKCHQAKQIELEKAKARRGIKITAGLILAIILILVARDSIVAKFDPYKYQTITDKEFTKPLKIIVTKKIGDNEYYLKETNQGNISLYQKISANSQDDKYLLELPFDSKSVVDFWYDSKTNTTFVVDYGNIFYNKTRLEQIFKLSNSTNGQEPVQVLKTASLSLYSGGDRILDYFPDTDTLLMENGGGDGCGGWGTVWVLNGNVSQTLQEYGGGCALKEKPRYVGYDGSFLYFAVFDPLKTGSFGEVIGLKEIFKINPRTKSKESIINPDISENIVQARLSDDNKNIVMVTDKGKNIILNLELNSINKEASPSAGK